ncbi:unnamed protein product [Bemisia tabaci]|uniref:Battenin n=1 Tax=Bemisia tabaci TaxID=7038 RepID=A0A9P0G1I2_BEMTA|nr:unnamed protein product [Bemisia tabaci]
MMFEATLDPEMTLRKPEKKNVSIAKNVGTKSLLAFWILGVCNNMGYVVMLSAAHDILGGGKHNAPDNPRECNTISTGAILLADIVPALTVKIISPFFPLHEHIRMVVTTVSAAVAFCMVGYSSQTNALWLAYTGVALTSFTSGLGEATLLSFMSFYGDKNVITAWGSGTGGAGFLGAFYYAAMVGLGLSSTATLYTLISVPVLMAIAFWIILDRPNISGSSSTSASAQSGESSESYQNSGRKIEEDANSSAYLVPTARSTHTFSERLSIMPKLVKYMVPLGLVYFFEYLINQGLFELLYFRNIWLTHNDQYRWYQVLYQIGVFISRSSLTFVKFNQLWLFAVLQCCNLVYLYFDSVYTLSPTVFIVFGFILFEGLLGGAAYVNTYYKIDTEMPIEEREFSMSMTSFADALGICLAGLSAIPLHNYICGLPLSSKAS